jgi:hypothetical protein
VDTDSGVRARTGVGAPPNSRPKPALEPPPPELGVGGSRRRGSPPALRDSETGGGAEVWWRKLKL